MQNRSSPSSIYTERLFIRRPTPDDAQAVFDRYAGDAEVTRYLGWPRHTDLSQTTSFLNFSDQQWEQDGVGPYLIFDKLDSHLIGGIGLDLQADSQAPTGYVLARDSWGCGYATEALHAMVAVARSVSISTVYALCHPDHKASVGVLEKCGFTRESRLSNYLEFPILEPLILSDVLRYSTTTE